MDASTKYRRVMNEYRIDGRVDDVVGVGSCNAWLSGKSPPPRARSLGAIEVMRLSFGVARIKSGAFTSYIDIHLLPGAEQVAPVSFLLRTSSALARK